MCYSAIAWQTPRKLDAALAKDLTFYLATFKAWHDRVGDYKFPLGMLDSFRRPKTDDERKIHDWIEAWRGHEAQRLQEETFKQARRLADANRALESKETKTALNEQRIATNKVEQLKRKLADLARTKHEARDDRIFPGIYSSVLAAEQGRRFVAPMRYGCRPAGKPASYDRRYPGTYNARRDNLEGFWSKQFGHTHAIMVVDSFYENVEVDGRNRSIQFTPRTGEPMYVPCLWSHWQDPKGQAPDLLSFAAITDDPEPEVAAAGHDRTIINLRHDQVDAWLNPDPNDLASLYALFDDKQHPFYEHRLAA